MLDGGVWSKHNEEEVLGVRDILIENFLRRGFNVIVDDTNLDPKHAKRIKEMIGEMNEELFNVDIEEKFFDVPVYECIERDKLRGNKMVGEKVIIDMWKKYLSSHVETPMQEMQVRCIIVDVDGTLAYKCDRDIYDLSKVDGDIPNTRLIWIIRFLKEGCRVFIMSGRDDSSKQVTEQWLTKNGVRYDDIFMRKAGDMRPDYIVKKEMYEEHIKDRYEVMGVFDDRPSLIRMWKEQGLFVLDCNRQDSRINF